MARKQELWNFSNFIAPKGEKASFSRCSLAACFPSAADSAPTRAAATVPLRVQGQTGTAPARLRTKALLSDGGPGPTLPNATLVAPGGFCYFSPRRKVESRFLKRRVRKGQLTFPTSLFSCRGFAPAGATKGRSPSGGFPVALWNPSGAFLSPSFARRTARRLSPERVGV